MTEYELNLKTDFIMHSIVDKLDSHTIQIALGVTSHITLVRLRISKDALTDKNRS